MRLLLWALIALAPTGALAGESAEQVFRRLLSCQEKFDPERPKTYQELETCAKATISNQMPEPIRKRITLWLVRAPIVDAIHPCTPQEIRVGGELQGASTQLCFDVLDDLRAWKGFAFFRTEGGSPRLYKLKY